MWGGECHSSQIIEDSTWSTQHNSALSSASAQALPSHRLHSPSPPCTGFNPLLTPHIPLPSSSWLPVPTHTLCGCSAGIQRPSLWGGDTGAAILWVLAQHGDHLGSWETGKLATLPSSSGVKTPRGHPLLGKDALFLSQISCLEGKLIG